MSKPLTRFPDLSRNQIMTIKRRVAMGTKGLGYWAAIDAAKKLWPPVKKEEVKEQPQS